MYNNPFTIVAARGELYTFRRIYSDLTSAGKGAELRIPVVKKILTIGDYTISGYEELVAVERKERTDFVSSLLSRREDTEAKIAIMNNLLNAAIVIESEFSVILEKARHNTRKGIFRTYLAWSIRYPNVHWYFMRDFRDGEIFTFRFLERFWKIRNGICD